VQVMNADWTGLRLAASQASSNCCLAESKSFSAKVNSFDQM
jgi:hypothetical protein